MNLLNYLSVTFTLFAVIDILGTIPLYLKLNTNKTLDPLKGSFYSGLVMVFFLYAGTYLFKFFGISPEHFALAGSLLILFFGIKMMFGIHTEEKSDKTIPSSFFPLAFPLIAGPGTLSTLLSFKSQFSDIDIIMGVLTNLFICYIGLKSSDWMNKKIGVRSLQLIEKIFGVFLVAMGIKMFLTNLVFAIKMVNIN